MRADCVSSMDFKGKLVIINELSNKPKKCIDIVRNNLEKQIQPKNYNLYIEQDYRTCRINIGASFYQPRYMSGVIAHEELPITAKSNRYVYATKRAIDKHETSEAEKEQQIWEQEQIRNKKEEMKDILGTILLSPVFILGMVIHEINPQWGNKFEKLLEKIGI